jgi:hypothetical protein
MTTAMTLCAATKAIEAAEARHAGWAERQALGEQWRLALKAKVAGAPQCQCKECLDFEMELATRPIYRVTR